MHNRLVSLMCAIAVCGLTVFTGAPRAFAQCNFDWAEGFGRPGLSGNVYALASISDRNGPSLYAGGNFSYSPTESGPIIASKIARWNGASWLPLQIGNNEVSGTVLALADFDDGTGSALYVGGAFTTAGGIAVNNVARWDGTNWFALGSGVGGPGVEIRALTVFDDGTGPALFAAGNFGGLAKWSGVSWTAVGGGICGQTNAMAVYDDGSGPALYVAGSISLVGTTGTACGAGGTSINNIARWNGSSWSPLGNGAGGTINALSAYGNELIVGGLFNSAGGVNAGNIAKWNGSAWTPLGSNPTLNGTNGTVLALGVFDDDGTGPHAPELYAGGAFNYAGDGGGNPANRIAKWNGTSWVSLDAGVSGLSQVVYCLSAYDRDGIGPAPASLFVAGSFNTAGSISAGATSGTGDIARWDGAEWSALGDGVSGGSSNTVVRALRVFDDDGTEPHQPALYAGGDFSKVNGISASHIAAWSGSSWSPVGSGLGEIVYSLIVYDADGTGSGLPALYAGTDTRVFEWDGASWTQVGNTIGAVIFALVAFDDGTGNALYAAGASFGIRKLVGTTWTNLAGGGVNGSAWAVKGFDQNSGFGRCLFVGGNFAQAGSPSVLVNRITKWSGSSWTALDSGVSPLQVWGLGEFNDGTGTALYVGGQFTTAGSAQIPVNNIAKWNGSSWSSLGTGMSGGPFGPKVYSFGIFDEGAGDRLYACGGFHRAGGVVVGDGMYNGSIAKWDGANWAALANGLNDEARCSAAFDDGSGPALYVGGWFSGASGKASAAIAKWQKADPRISQHPVSRFGCLGGSVSLPVMANGSAALAYQWRKNGANLSDDAHVSGSTSATLSINPISLADAGDYDVVVSDSCGSAISAIATLTIKNPITITSHPTDRIACEVGQASFSVAAGGGGPFSYQWRKNGANLNNGGSVSGATSSTLTINPLATTDAGNYDVVVTSSCGSITSNPAVLTVQANSINWTQVGSGNPSPRNLYAMAYDSIRGKTVLFGGSTALPTPNVNGETWEWNGISWALRTTGGPTPRRQHAMAYHRASGLTILFGGTTGSLNGETWGWNGLTWQQFSGGSSPSARRDHAMVYDSSRQKVVLFGGNTGSFNNETWEWNGAVWTSRGSGGPSARATHAMAYDNARGRTVLFGGTNGTVLGDTWEWNGTTWAQVASTGPSPRANAAMSYDSARGVTVLFGGASGSTQYGDTWEWNGTTWTQRTISGPLSRSTHAMAYDGSRGRTILFGGFSGFLVNDTWVMANNAPTITAGPVDQSICVAGNATFAVTLSGPAVLGYQWRQDTVNIPGATSGTLILNAVSLADAGYYDVVVTGACGFVTSASGLLTVITDAPSISQGPGSAAACVGGSAMFTVSATGPTPIFHRWRRNLVDLSDDGNVSGSTSPSLSINPVGLGDAGAYDCVVTNPCGGVDSTDATLTVWPSGSGDGNGSGVANGGDIQGMLNAILGVGPPSAAYCAYDMNMNGVVDLGDIDGFVALLLGN